MLKEHFSGKLPVPKAFSLFCEKNAVSTDLKGQIKLHAHTIPKGVYLETLCAFLYNIIDLGKQHNTFELHLIYTKYLKQYDISILELLIFFKMKHDRTLHALDTSFTIIYQRIVTCFQNYDISTCAQSNLMADLYCTLQF